MGLPESPTSHPENQEARRAEAVDLPTAGCPPCPPVSAHRVRAALSAATRTAALLQRPLPEGGTGMVAVEGPEEIPGHGGGQTETERSKPTLPGTCQEATTTSR